MTPLSLTLKGFRGIRDGLGRDELTLDFESLGADAALIAITGANGRGKSTVLDNMHPYLLMPSRAADSGSGPFNYYPHVVFPESEKLLTWRHAGRTYRSHVVIRLGGRNRTDAYLFEVSASGAWLPVRLADGTISDGKTSIYTRCVEAICGSTQTFFTSVFSAQGKRQLSNYQNAEIKALLADLLDQEEILALGRKAAETARLLKAGLVALRQEQAHLESDVQRVASDLNPLADAQARAPSVRAAQVQARDRLEAARQHHARVQAEHCQEEGLRARRAQIQADMDAALEAQAELRERCERQLRDASQRQVRLEQRVQSRQQQERERWQAWQLRMQQHRAALADADAVQRAARRVELATSVAVQRQRRSEHRQNEMQLLELAQAKCETAEQSLIALEREAGQAALRESDLRHRFGLTARVPCAGTDLQGQCQLLGDAHAAYRLLPDASAILQRLAGDKRELHEQISALRREVQQSEMVMLSWQRAQRKEQRALARQRRLELLAGRQQEMQRLRQSLSELEMQCGKQPCAGEWAEDELAERNEIAADRCALDAQRAKGEAQHACALERLRTALAALPVPCNALALIDAQQVLSHAMDVARQAEVDVLQIERDAEAHKALARQAQELASKQSRLAQRLASVETELQHWQLFSRCMSHDGLLALIIDDAGPTLAALANDLLLACYGHRFTVSIRTQLTTGKGEAREGFDIQVHDGASGESKSVGLMSGGERVWINEALIRAVALYLAQNTGRRYESLFCDEADGPLDAERKRMFMAMKREVLRVGGYEREFFISQTPALSEEADVVIDLDRLALETGA